jgi:hypothetical protein
MFLLIYDLPDTVDAAFAVAGFKVKKDHVEQQKKR